MAISFTCPSCEHRLKVKDELAGRKVKCPSCGNGVSVPADEDEEEPAKMAQPRRKGQDDASDEERPRKKKKKKKGNKGLVIGLAVGAVVLVAVVVVLVIVLTRPKNSPNKEPDDGGIAQNPPPKQDLVQQPQGGNPQPQPHPEQRVAGLANRGEDTAVMSDFNNIKLFYVDYCDTNRRGPPSSKAFADAIRRQAPGIAKRIDDQIYYVFPGKHQGPSSVIAYDVPGNTAGMHIVLTGDLAVQAMPQAQLQQYIKQQTKP